MTKYKREDILVYVAGPYTKGPNGEPPVINTRTALQYAEIVSEAGFTPFIPHLFHFWEFLSPKPYQFWMDLDEKMLARSDVMLRLPGESSGADQEEEFCEKTEIPHFAVLFEDMERERLPEAFVRAFDEGLIEPRNGVQVHPR